MTSTPLHVKIADLIRSDIQNKKYINKLPNERELSQHYEVSRTTVGRALSQLAKEGLIFQKQGSGSYINTIFVEGKNDFSGYSFGPVGLTHTSNQSHDIVSTIHDFTVIKADSDKATRLQVNEGSFLYRILRSRHIDSVIISLEELYIPIHTIPNLKVEDFEKSFYEFVRKELKLNLTRSFYNISILEAHHEVSDILDVALNEKVVKIDELVFLDNGQPFQISIVYMRTDYFSYNGTSELNY